MVQFTNRSIDLLEELADASGNEFHMNRRGYLYCTGDPERLDRFRAEAQAIARLGAGLLRTHDGVFGESAYKPADPEGCSRESAAADLLLDRDLIRTHFPYLSENVLAAQHVRRAGWLSAQQLGMHLSEKARVSGVHLLN